jgi:hypothetical protein
MNMPGFTAETSLYNTSGHYRAMAGTPNDLIGSGGVLPQLPIGFCMADCDFTYPNDSFLSSVCKLGCFGDGGGGGGGGGEHCRPTCGQCQPDPGSPTGRSKPCIKSNCDDYDKPC